MKAETFIDYYKIMGVRPNATQEAIALRFRSLARRYHPDNANTGDRAKFEALLQANDTLRDRTRRAQYHKDNSHHLAPLPPEEEGHEEASSPDQAAGDESGFLDAFGIGQDVSVQNNILTMLYFQRRRDTKNPGMGNAELERLSGCPHEHLEFHIWYLKEKGWISRGENGLLSITVDGVDRAAHIFESERRLITSRS